MNQSAHNPFSDYVTVFHEFRLPEPAMPAGYAALIDAYDVAAPWSRVLYATTQRHTVYRHDNWHMLTKRHAPSATLEGHLTFALKHEGLDLAVLKRLFQALGPEPIATLALEKPTGSYTRRIWFLYEWLLGVTLPIDDAEQGNYVPVVDPDMQLAGASETSRRHRVKNNLPGSPAFCPMVFRTEKLEAMFASDLAAKARAVIDDLPGDIISRTAAFLLLKDSKSSYAIEGEHPPQNRIQRWGRAIGEAGQYPLDKQELLRLQQIVIGDDRFVTLGLRHEGGFIGERDRDGNPLPEHISAKPDDLDALIEGMIAFEAGPAQTIDPVVAAAMLAFGFVYAHPFEDGNGRIHRYLIHHILAERGFNPPGLVFPVSAVMLKEIETYKQVLEDYSQRLLPLISWRITDRQNVEVVGDTADFYRFFDATPHAEFLYDCVHQTIEHDLPEETQFLKRYDIFRQRIEELVEMPDQTIDLLFRFLRQNEGQLSKRAREKEFAKLTDAESREIETIFNDVFGD